jgi:hypothetical protein
MYWQCVNSCYLGHDVHDLITRYTYHGWSYIKNENRGVGKHNGVE